MQNAALAELGLADEWSYEAIEVAPEDFADLVRSLGNEGFAGVNVTVPHKLAALALADRASTAASAIGAANTLTFTDAGIEAENTDAGGLIAALPEPPGGRRALVLGAGGSARAAVWALGNAGASVSVWNRTAARAEALAAEFGVAHERGGVGGRAAAARRLRPAGQLHHGRPGGGGRRDRGVRRPEAASPACRLVAGDTGRGGPGVRVVGDAADRGCRAVAGRGSSRASRSSSTREPPRCGSGPAWTRRWRRCGGRHAEVEQQMAPDKHPPVGRPAPSPLSRESRPSSSTARCT